MAETPKMELGPRVLTLIPSFDVALFSARVTTNTQRYSDLLQMPPSFLLATRFGSQSAYSHHLVG